MRLSASASLPSIAAQRSIDPLELRRTLAGELDWIVMKTLEKERSRRYETATALASDIQRYLNEEAVEACPPSRSYQLKKFVRKHKGKVVAASVVLATLLIGIVGTSWGLVRATHAERAAVESEQKATQERDAKEQQRKLAEAAAIAEAEQREFADQQRELAERQLCIGILRPIGYGDELTDGELRSFVDWSAIPDARLKLRVLEIALEDPESAFRVARRSERSIQAAVGISPDRRAKVIELLSAKQRETSVDPRIRVAACWLAMELSSNDLPAFEESIRYVSDNPGVDGINIRRFVSLATKRISSSSTELVACFCDALIAILEKSTDDDVLRAASEGLEAVAPKLSAEQVTRGGNALIAILEKATDDDVLQAAGEGLASLAPRLSNDQVTRGLDTLIAILEKSTYHRVLYAAGEGLAALAPKLSAEQVTRGGDALIALLEKSDQSVWDVASGRLVALASKLSAEQVTRGWDALIAILEKSTHDWVSYAAGEGLVALAPKLSSQKPLDVAKQFVDMLGSSARLIKGAASIIDLLDKQSAEPITIQAATMVLDLAMSREYFEGGRREFNGATVEAQPIINSFQNPESLAKLLWHPSCVGELREFMLMRLEELLFHGGQPVFQPKNNEETVLDGADEAEDTSFAERRATIAERRATMGEQRATQPPARRFQSLHDASAWIAQNWPDFDLEATHPVTYYPEAR